MDAPNLPQELLDRVTDILGSLKDVDCLRNIAAASRHHFLHQARSHLFRRLRLRGYCLSNNHTHILRENRSLFKYARAVRFSMNDAGDESPDGQQESLSARLYNDDLRDVFDELEDLESVHLNIDDWDDLLEDSTLFKLFQPSLQHLVIDSIRRLPLLQLRRLSKLRTLRYHGWGQKVGADEPMEGFWAPLKVLDWRSEDLSVFLSWCPTSSVARSLVSLNVRIQSARQHQDVWSLIAAGDGSRTWKTITLEYDVQEELEALECLDDNIDRGHILSALPSLQHFSISFLARPDGSFGEVATWDASTAYPFIHFCAHILGKIPMPSLEALNISMGIPHFGGHIDPSGPDVSPLLSRLTSQLQEHVARERLDTILGDPYLFPKLRYLRFDIALWPGWLLDRAVPKGVLCNHKAETLRAFENTKARVYVLDVGVEDSVEQAKFRSAESDLLEMLLDGIRSHDLDYLYRKRDPVLIQLLNSFHS